jgi:hypothetical protein
VARANEVILQGTVRGVDHDILILVLASGESRSIVLTSAGKQLI